MIAIAQLQALGEQRAERGVERDEVAGRERRLAVLDRLLRQVHIIA